MDKLSKYKSDKWTVMWIRRQLNDQIQSFVICGPKSSWRQISSGTSHGAKYWGQYCSTPSLMTSVMGQNAPSPSSQMIWKRGVVDAPDGCATFEGLWQENRAEMNLMKGEYWVPHSERNNSSQQHTLGARGWKAALPRKTWDSWWITICPEPAVHPCGNKKANSVLGCMRRNVASR